MKSLRTRVLNRETLLGCFLGLGSALTTEIVGLVGFDWVVLDLEHGAGFECDLLGQFQALNASSTSVVVRIESAERPRFHRVLDLGAEGVMMPRIDTLEQAKTAAASLLYPPRGIRGIAKMIRGSQFGNSFDDYFANANERVLGVLQVESESCLHSVEEVAKLDGVDVLFVGPRDLSQSLGVYGQFQHPKYLEALRLTAEAARRNNKAAGILVGRTDELTDLAKMGYTFLGCGSDVEFINTGARNLLTNMQNAVAKK